ncbi:ABC transporter ATP-binding protein [Halopseudomonas yangmingensis]|uniref:Iron complex transport system ATP-binding protein n=1 Tax=Halopseudomonas yangmingensis TaxID=1720063 RepID=A0A1I4NC07_9GAMM|nr:ABC transporter ATP-binding protein [Halopseudomonas yangmingensis]SFM12847.1 iron complex transport system ATP-binding protein [Halopseudomonas yangmingensis]
MTLMQLEAISHAERLQAVSLDLQPGEVLGLIGPNGAGKSTLLHCLAGILPAQGQAWLQGQPLQQLSERQRARRIGFLPQHNQSAWALSVADIVSLGRLPWGDDDRQAARAAAAATEVEQFWHRRIDRLSGGEQARVWLARVLAGQPQLVLADEPVASLDLYHQQHVLQVLRDYAAGERGVMLSVHDLSLAARYCDRLCLLHRGRMLAFGSPAEVLTREHLRQAFGVDTHIDLHNQPPVILPR